MTAKQSRALELLRGRGWITPAQAVELGVSELPKSAGIILASLVRQGLLEIQRGRYPLYRAP
jgi:hypothetical protein